MDHQEKLLEILTVTLEQLDLLLAEEAELPQSVDGWPLSVLFQPMLII